MKTVQILPFLQGLVARIQHATGVELRPQLEPAFMWFKNQSVSGLQLAKAFREMAESPVFRASVDQKILSPIEKFEPTILVSTLLFLAAKNVEATNITRSAWETNERLQGSLQRAFTLFLLRLRATLSEVSADPPQDPNVAKWTKLALQNRKTVGKPN